MRRGEVDATAVGYLVARQMLHYLHGIRQWANNYPSTFRPANEGSVWKAALCTSYRTLYNLVTIFDLTTIAPFLALLA